MPVRVELIAEAVQDLARYMASGNLSLFLKKLLRLEEAGEDAGVPLGRDLTGWRKIVVGDRHWRIIFTMNPEETIATVWMIGDRDDAECYEEARRRVHALADTRPDAASHAAVMFQISRLERPTKRQRPKG